MIIIFVRKSKNGEASPTETTDKESVQKHNEEMKKFRLNHPKIKETAAKEPVTAENLLLLPVTGVKLSKNSQN